MAGMERLQPRWSQWQPGRLRKRVHHLACETQEFLRQIAVTGFPVALSEPPKYFPSDVFQFTRLREAE